MLAAQCEQTGKIDPQLFVRVSREVSADQVGSKAIKPGSDRRVCRKQVAHACRVEADVERNTILRHKASGAFQHDERRMSLIEMAYFRFDPETLKQAPAANSEHEFLRQAQLEAAAIELAGDTA